MVDEARKAVGDEVMIMNTMEAMRLSREEM